MHGQKDYPLIEYMIPADFGKQQERKVSFCRSTERLWRKHDKMCEEDRIEPSARAQGEMLEEIKALNSDPEIKQFHLSDARLKSQDFSFEISQITYTRPSRHFLHGSQSVARSHISLARKAAMP